MPVTQGGLSNPPFPRRQTKRGGRKSFGRLAGLVLTLFSLAILLAALSGAFDGALAQTSPFGGARAVQPLPEMGGLVGWLLAKQAEFYRALSGFIRAAKADGAAVWGLLGVSFLYGVFHAAGPGHGKAVISSYLLANEETWRRGITLSFASALLQALVAVALVGIAALLFNATKKTMDQASHLVEIASYALIAAVGARLTWAKGGAFLRALRQWFAGRTGAEPVLAHQYAHAHAAQPAMPATHGHGHAHALSAHEHSDHDHFAHGHAHHAHADHHADHVHAHHVHEHDHHDRPAAGRDDSPHAHEPADHAHVHDEHCGHSHGPEPEQLAGRGGWRRGLSAIVAVGLRPCSGAILVLVFALAQGLFWAGVASTFMMGLGTAITVASIATFTVAAKALAKRFAAHRAGGGVLLMRGIEAGAAALVLVFGLALLAGYLVTERMI